MKTEGFWKNVVTATSITIFTLFIIIGKLLGTTEFLPEAIIFIGLTLFYNWTYNTFKITIPIYVMLIFGHTLHMMGTFGYYSISPLPLAWERITHFFGSLPWGILFYRFFEQYADIKHFTNKNMVLLLAVFLAATGIGAIVEISEFTGYLILGEGEGAFRFGDGDGANIDGIIQHVGGGWINTGWDFLTNTAAIITGITIMLLIRVFGKKPTKAYYYDTIGNYSRKV